MLLLVPRVSGNFVASTTCFRIFSPFKIDKLQPTKFASSITLNQQIKHVKLVFKLIVSLSSRHRYLLRDVSLDFEPNTQFSYSYKSALNWIVWRMLKQPALIPSGLYILGLQDRPNKGGYFFNISEFTSRTHFSNILAAV